jgi:hypothetical protein
MRHDVLPVLIPLLLFAGCASEALPSATPTTSSSAVPTTTRVALTPRTAPASGIESYLYEAERRGATGYSDDELVEAGQTACRLVPLSDRLSAISAVTAGVGGDVGAATAIVDAAKGSLCATAQYESALRTTTPASTGPVTSFGSGTYEVGVDVAPGEYRTPGTDSCYWARLRNNDGSRDDILDNSFGAGPQVVTLRDGEFFENQGCGMWAQG